MKTVIEKELTLKRSTARKVWDDWTRLWNGEYELASQIVGDHFDLVLTAAVADDPATISNEKQVEAWIRRVRASFTSIRYDTIAGPYVDTEAEVIACGWEARGVFAGKTDSPADQPGKTFHILGTDILQLKNGRICGCRTISYPARP